MKRLCFIAIVAAVVLAPLSSNAQTGGGYDLSRHHFDGGGGRSVSSIDGHYSMLGAAGQFDANIASGGEASLVGGFISTAYDVTKLPVPGEVDFTTGVKGWLGGVLLGGNSATQGANGLCMDVPETGTNLVAWVSPEDYIGLIDYTAFRITATANTNITNVDEIPLWSMVYDNFNLDGFGNTYGGEQIFIDQAGGANGIGRPQGRTNFQLWACPSAALTDQWRGDLDPANNAFVPFADTFNDMRLTVRVLDFDAAGILAENDAGTVCVSKIEAVAISLGELSVAFSGLWNPPLNQSTHAAQTTDQQNEGAGIATIDNGDAEAHYKLTETGPGSRKTLIPFEVAESTLRRQLFPVLWASDQLYLGQSAIEADISEADPVDTIFINFDTATTELVGTHVTNRGSPPDNMYLVGSPKLRVNTGGTPEIYFGLMHGHNKTAVDLDAVPDYDRFRATVDFINVPQIAPTGTGTDALTLSSLSIFGAPLP